MLNSTSKDTERGIGIYLCYSIMSIFRTTKELEKVAFAAFFAICLPHLHYFIFGLAPLPI